MQRIKEEQTSGVGSAGWCTGVSERGNADEGNSGKQIM